MTEELWIKKIDQTDEELMTDVISDYRRDGTAIGSQYFMALYTDKYICASIDKLDSALADVAWLLELRVFDRVRELWAHRSMLGEPFSWRIADDKKLEDEANNPDSYRIESRQKLDIDKEHEPDETRDGMPQYGGLLVRSTGKSVYELPAIVKAQSLDAMALVSYIRYDDNGIANVVDYRLKEFCILGEADNTKGGERR